MKKQTTRRKMLISSVAMLLVAMVALGTATFAWFTTNTTATAGGINVKTVAVSDLQVAKYDQQYGTTVDYGVSSQVLYPASTVDGTNWFNTTAEDQNNYAKATSASITDVSAKYVGSGALSTEAYYFTDKLYIKNAGDTTINGITISAQFTWNSDNYMRVALVSVSKGDSFEKCVVSDTTDTWDAYADANGTTTTITPLGTNLNSVEVGSLAPGSSAEYNIYVWYEGQDSDCKSANAGKELTDIDITVTGTPAT